MIHELSTDNYQKQQEAIKKKFGEIAKSSNSEILKNRAEKEKRQANPEIMQNCQIVRMLIDEGLEMYKSGEMNFEQMIDDLHKSMKAMVKK